MGIMTSWTQSHKFVSRSSCGEGSWCARIGPMQLYVKVGVLLSISRRATTLVVVGTGGVVDSGIVHSKEACHDTGDNQHRWVARPKKSRLIYRIRNRDTHVKMTCSFCCVRHRLRSRWRPLCMPCFLQRLLGTMPQDDECSKGENCDALHDSICHWCGSRAFARCGDKQDRERNVWAVTLLPLSWLMEVRN